MEVGVGIRSGGVGRLRAGESGAGGVEAHGQQSGALEETAARGSPGERLFDLSRYAGEVCHAPTSLSLPDVGPDVGADAAAAIVWAARLMAAWIR